MKKCIYRTLGLIGVAFIAATALCNFSSVSFAAEPIVLKGVTGLPRNAIQNQDIPGLADEVFKASNGRLKIEWTGGSEVIPTFDQVEAVKKGVMDMLLCHPRGYFKSHMAVAEAGGLSQLTAWEERKSGAFDLWNKIFREQTNGEYLGRFHSKIKFCIYTNFRINTLEDFKGKNIRVMPLYIPLLQALGATPVTIPPPDVYTAMERGVVQGYLWPEIGIVSVGWHEVTKFVLDPGVFQIEDVVLVNLDKFNKLPKDLQTVLKDSVAKFEFIGTETLEKAAKVEWETMQKRGIQKCSLPPADAKKFVDLAYELTWNKIIKDDPVYGPQLRKLTSK